MIFIVGYLLIGLGYAVSQVNSFRLALELLQTGDITEHAKTRIKESDLAELRRVQARLKADLADMGQGGKNAVIAITVAFLFCRATVLWPLFVYNKFKAKV